MEKYEEKRRITGNNGFADIPEVAQDTVNVIAGMTSLGIEPSDIRMIKDASHACIKTLFKDLRKEVMNDDIPTLIFFYYAGHGMCNNLTYAVLNEEKTYPLEGNLRALAADEDYDTFIIGLFDCCREKVVAVEGDRGSGDHAGMNLILSFGCSPNNTTPKKSTIAVNYFEHLKLRAN